MISEAVMEGKGDKDDADINLPVDFNDSSCSGSAMSSARVHGFGKQ